jgi:hypothetical protein
MSLMSENHWQYLFHKKKNKALRLYKLVQNLKISNPGLKSGFSFQVDLLADLFGFWGMILGVSGSGNQDVSIGTCVVS